jgi:hypothetical protein
LEWIILNICVNQRNLRLIKLKEYKIMKQLVVLAGCAVVLAGLVGCQNDNRDVEVIIDGDGQFPESVVGVWEADTAEGKWAFKFERDGSILKIRHAFAGEVNLREGGIYLEGPDPGTYALFVMGPCEAEYDANTRELSVKIILEHYVMKLPQGTLEGKCHDYFQGPVSEDGKVWKADWKNYGWLEGATPPDANIIEANPVPLVFTKLDIK